MKVNSASVIIATSILAAIATVFYHFNYFLVSFCSIASALLISNVYLLACRNQLNKTAKSLKIKPTQVVDTIADELHQLRKQFTFTTSVMAELGDRELSTQELMQAGIFAEPIKKLQEKLSLFKNEELKRTWAAQGIAKISEIRKNQEDKEKYAAEVISFLVKYLDANQGAFHSAEEENGEEFLQQLATYAYGKRKYLSQRINPGQGLVGQCMMERDIIYLTEVPFDYIKITSGLGEATPTSVLLSPLVFKDKTFGVLEFASFAAFEKYHIDFILQASESIAAEFAAFQNYAHIGKLLESSQSLTRELQDREAEMNNHMIELRSTQEEMEKKQSELDGVFDAINRTMAAAEFTTSGELSTANETLKNVLVMTEHQLSSQHIKDFVSGEHKTLLPDLSLGKVISGEYEIKNSIGKKVWLNTTFNPVMNNRNEVMKIYMMSQDVTERKSREKEFETLSLVADHTDNSVVITDASQRILYVNKGFSRLTGYSMDECAGKIPGEFLQGPDTDKETLKRLSLKIKAGDPVYEEILNYNKDGRPYWISMVINPVKNSEGKVERYISVQTDITETKKKALDFHYKLEAIARTNAMMEFDPMGRISEVNELFRQITGYDTGDLIGKSYEMLIPLADRNKPQILIMWKNLLLGQAFSGEFRCVDKYGKEQWMSGTYNPIFDLSGKLSKIMMLSQFITQEREKRQELSFYVNALRQSFPLFEINNQLQFKSCNEIFLNLLKLKRLEFSRKNLSDVLTPESLMSFRKIVESTNQDQFNESAFAFVNGNGIPQYFSGNITLIRDQAKNVLRAIVILTEREKVEA